MVRLDYKFDGQWTDYDISEDAFIERLVKYIDLYYNIKIDGTNNAILKMLFDLFDDGTEFFLENICEKHDFSDYIHRVFEKDAREQYEEEKLLDGEV